MKVKELIAILQECDQELPVFGFANEDIHDISVDNTISDRVDINVHDEVSKMDNIYQLVYYEGDEKHIVWSANKVELDEMIKGWEEQGFGTGDDIIKQISFNDKSELVDQLNNLENKS